MIIGLNELIHTFTRSHDGFNEEFGRALYEEIKIEAKEVERRTPRKTGALRRSIKVSKPDLRNKTVAVTISVGGETAPYAVYVHEDLEAVHPIGQAKYLSSVINESKRHMAARVARRIDINRAIRK